MTPDAFTNQELFLEVGDGHQIYIQDWGNSKAKTPIICLHGGPGDGCKDRYKGQYDPKVERVIFFDQRGSGRSLPKGSIEHNTTAELVEDIEKIRTHLKLNQIILFGGSWGSCLALAYGIKYPKNVSAMVIFGIFTGRKSEIEHLDNGEFRDYFPDLWDKYVDTVPKEYKDDPSKYHYEQIDGKDSEKAKRSAYVYSSYIEGPLLSLDDRYTPENYDDFDPDSMSIELYYLKNGCFLPEGYIFNNADKLTMPIWLVQGRYDMVCPPVTAYELSKKLPKANLIWTTSGHKTERESWNVMRSVLLQLTS